MLHDLCLTCVLLGIEHLMLDAAETEHTAEELGCLKDDPDAPPKQYHRDSVTVLERERRAPQEKKSDRGEKGEKSVKDAEKNSDKTEKNGEKVEKND